MENQAKNDCVFCKIIQGRDKAHLVYEDQDFIAILDRHPVFFGHSLVIPKQHIETFYELPEHLLISQFILVRRIGKAIEQAMLSEGSFIAMNNKVSQSVPHFHVHIVPRNYKDGLRGFFWPRQKYTDNEQMVSIQDKIITAILYH